MSGTAEEKYQLLLAQLRHLERVLVAFSGGVDSTLLLFAAHEALGAGAAAVTACSALTPARDRAEGEAFCAALGIRQLHWNFDWQQTPGFAENPPDRCYWCKRALFGSLLLLAREQGAALCEGSNMDDLQDYRPGLRALRELEVHSPLQAAGLTKAEIRSLSQQAGLPTWNKPSFACLASRFAYGEKITEQKLRMTDKAEQLLARLGFSQYRVRVHGTLARIEVLPEQLELALSLRGEIDSSLREYGFSYTALDLRGYRTGSMNEALKK